MGGPAVRPVGERHLRYRLLAATALASFWLPGQTHAEDAPPVATAAPDDQSATAPAPGGDIVVTAERRETSLQRTPISIGAVGATQVREERLQIFQDLEGRIAGLAAPNSILNMQSVYIRGIGTSDPGTYPAVGTYVDDVYLPRIFGASLFDLLDLEQVEVLRGPQATLYGQNTSGGAIVIRSKTPTNRTEVSASLDAGSYGTLEGRGYFSGPIVEDKLYASVAYTHRQDDGYIDDPYYSHKLQRVRTDEFRAKLRYTPTERLDATISVDGLRDDSDNTVFIPQLIPGIGKRTTYAFPTTTPGGDLELGRKSWGVTGRINYDLTDALTLRSITAYRELTDNPSPWDYDGTPQALRDFTQFIHQNQFSQEVQAFWKKGNFEFTGGAIYFHENFRFSRISGQNLAFSEVDSDIKDENYGIYGQLKYRPTSKLTITGGLRYNIERQKYDNTSYNLDDSLARTTEQFSVNGLHHKWTAVLPKASIDYQWTPDLLTYLSFTKGQKTGGYNRSASTALIASLPIDPENVSAYEAGIKLASFDRKLRTNVDVFYSDYRDYQASVTNPVIDGVSVPGLVTVNAAKAKTYGLELEATLQLTRDLSFYGSWSLLRSQFDNFLNPTGAPSGNYEGNRLPFASQNVAGFGGRYDIPLGRFGSIRTNISAKYVSPFYCDIGNTEPYHIGKQFYVDLGAEYHLKDTSWSVAVKATNIFHEIDQIYTNEYRPQVGSYTVSYTPPPRVIFSLRYNL